MARRRNSNRRRRRGSFSFLYKLLSMLIISATVVVAITLFFKVNSIHVSGNQRYTPQQVQDATEIQIGDNLYLLDKNEVAEKIIKALPYVEKIRINRKLPDMLVVEVQECGEPLAVVQDGFAWLISPKGKIVEQAKEAAAENYPALSGCELLAPSVGTQMAIASEYAAKQESMLALLTALEDAEMEKELDGIRLDDVEIIRMDYAGRFTVEMPYGADYVYKLRFLREAINGGKIQDNMTGTFNMTRDDGRVHFIQNVR